MIYSLMIYLLIHDILLLMIHSLIIILLHYSIFTKVLLFMFYKFDSLNLELVIIFSKFIANNLKYQKKTNLYLKYTKHLIY
jgi:hypothetical protein